MRPRLRQFPASGRQRQPDGPVQANPTGIFGDQSDDIDVTNIQIAEIYRVSISTSTISEAPRRHFIANLTIQESGQRNRHLRRSGRRHRRDQYPERRIFQDIGLGGFGNPDGDIFIANLTVQNQANPTVVSGNQIGDVDVTNVQVAEVHQDIDLGFG